MSVLIFCKGTEEGPLGSEKVILFKNMFFMGQKKKENTKPIYNQKHKKSSFHNTRNMLNIYFYGMKGTMVYYIK